MPTRTGQNQLAAFTRPAQSERPVTSAIVRGGFNTIGTSFNAHDGDQALHVQSGILVDRPAAGTLGRAFVLYDNPAQPLLTLDNGVSWVGLATDWAAVANKPSAFPPDAHSAALVTTGTLADGRLSANVALRNVGGAFSAKQAFNAGGAALSVGAGAVDHAYYEWFPRTALPAQRWAYFGFGSAGGTALQLVHEQNGDISFTTASTSVILRSTGRFEMPELVRFGAVNYTFPAADGTTGQVLRTDGAGTLVWATVASGAGGGTVAWVDITGRPATFPPSAHNQPAASIEAGTLSAGVILTASQLGAGAIGAGVTLPFSQLTGVPATFVPAAHTQSWFTITSVPTYLNADWDTTVFNKPATFPPAAHNQDWGTITGKPVTFPPQSHTHLWADLTDKPATFPPSAHGHIVGDVSGLQASLDSKATLGTSVAFSAITTAGNTVPGIIVATSAPSGVQPDGTLWVQVA